MMNDGLEDSYDSDFDDNLSLLTDDVTHKFLKMTNSHQGKNEISQIEKAKKTKRSVKFLPDNSAKQTFNPIHKQSSVLDYYGMGQCSIFEYKADSEMDIAASEMEYANE